MEWRLPQNEDSVPLILEDSHLTEDALELYCLNMLDEERDVPLVEEHLLYCQHCQKRLEKAQSFVDAAKSGQNGSRRKCHRRAARGIRCGSGRSWRWQPRLRWVWCCLTRVRWSSSRHRWRLSY